ncbi:MAG: twin-arginine translocase TatA/TatE family subunit [Desulfobacteraceae bacterium]|nr:twin-arginine translocase TatA/TatE family subunit [Desulfobacteraceae bacterium]
MFGLGTQELFIVLVIAFLVFGGKKLPELGSGLGKAITSFKRGIRETENEIASEKPMGSYGKTGGKPLEEGKAE